MHRFLLPLLVFAFAAPVLAQNSADLLNQARSSIASMTGNFDGAFMQGAGRTRVPFVVETGKNGAMRYHFNNPGEIVSVIVGTAPDGAMSQPIRGTDITREDLSLWYLKWPSGAAREASSAGMSFFVVPVSNNTGKGSYSRAEIWIHQTSLALFRVDAYDKAGALARRLEVEHIREFGEQRIADRLRVSTYQDGNKVSSTYVQLSKERS